MFVATFCGRLRVYELGVVSYKMKESEVVLGLDYSVARISV